MISARWPPDFFTNVPRQFRLGSFAGVTYVWLYMYISLATFCGFRFLNIRKFFKSFVQAILVFGLEMFMVTCLIGQKIWGFHNRLSCQLASMQPWRWTNISWIYPLPFWGGDGSIRTEAGRRVYCLAPENSCVVYYDAANTRPVHRGLVEARDAGV